ncbi:DKNYY domain-containing protein [Flavobacterium sp. FlaQc-51]|uniref:DKNYY domain-containing protein n=1 Tax=unclassified Flavobacterium TaxID=196869 RepID=UPI0009EBE5F6
MAQADNSSFKIIANEYSKDAKHVYFKNLIVAGANPDTFKAASEYGIWEDGKNRYKDGQII